MFIEAIVAGIGYSIYKSVKYASLPNKLEVDYLSADYLLELEKKYKTTNKTVTVKCKKYDEKCKKYITDKTVTHVIVFSDKDKADKLQLTVQINRSTDKNLNKINYPTDGEIIHSISNSFNSIHNRNTSPANLLDPITIRHKEEEE